MFSYMRVCIGRSCFFVLASKAFLYVCMDVAMYFVRRSLCACMSSFFVLTKSVLDVNYYKG